MKKVLPLVAVVVLAAIGVIIFVNKGDSKSSNSPTQTSTKTSSESFSSKNVDACGIVTKEVATQLLGSDAETGTSPAGQAATESIGVSTCTYTTKYVVGTPVSNLKSLSMLARVAKNDTGKQSNHVIFDSLPAGAQKVSGYGDNAYWNPTLGQFNILKHNNWYILSYGSSTKYTERTLDDAKKFADLVIDKL